METVIRVVVIYIFIYVALRLMGKREFSQLSPMEFVSLLMIPEIVAQSLIREDFSITNALLGLTTLFALVFLTSLILHRFKAAQGILVPNPTILVHNGKFIEEYLNKERVTPGEIYATIRENGLEDIAEVKYAVLEDDGKIAIIPQDPSKRQSSGQKQQHHPASG